MKSRKPILVLAVLFLLISLYHLSFTWKVYEFENEAKDQAKIELEKQRKNDPFRRNLSSWRNSDTTKSGQFYKIVMSRFVQNLPFENISSYYRKQFLRNLRASNFPFWMRTLWDAGNLYNDSCASIGDPRRPHSERHHMRRLRFVSSWFISSVCRAEKLSTRRMFYVTKRRAQMFALGTCYAPRGHICTLERTSIFTG